VDIPRKRIGLSMRMDDEPGAESQAKPSRDRKPSGSRRAQARSQGGQGQKAPQGAMAGALAEAMASARKGR